LKHYNHLANEAKAENEAAYKTWISQYTPLQIREANNARATLNRLKAKPDNHVRIPSVLCTPLQDDRLPKRPLPPYTFFFRERITSGDFKNIPITQSAKLVSAEWKALTESEKKVRFQIIQCASNPLT
jgi:hypothetical protein